MTIRIREARADDWPAMWHVMQPVIAAADTFSWDPGLPEEQARKRWLHELPGRTFVAVDDDGEIVGTAESGPNREGPGAHVATAGFMVSPDRRSRGAGRALCLHVLEQARADGFRAIQFNPSPRATPGRWPCGSRWDSGCWRRCRRRFATQPRATSACTSCIAGSDATARLTAPRALSSFAVPDVTFDQGSRDG